MIEEKRLRDLEGHCQSIKNVADWTDREADSMTTSISYNDLLVMVSSIRELQKDKARLDWFQRKNADVWFPDINADIRQAIDAAMKESS